MKPSMIPATFLLASGLLCTLLGLGFPLSCEVCTSDGPNCSGKLQTCTHDEDTCITILTEAKKEGSLAVTSYKGCAKSSECDSGFLAMTMNPENYIGSTRRCCQDDGCNQDPMPALVRNHTENGLRCPSCFDTFTETCTSTEDALCVGEETHCVAVTGLARSRDGLWKFDVNFAAQGCGTETACHIKPGTLVPSGSRLLTIKKTSCRPSPQASGKVE